MRFGGGVWEMVGPCVPLGYSVGFALCALRGSGREA